jgi:hypothetical protein
MSSGPGAVPFFRPLSTLRASAGVSRSTPRGAGDGGLAALLPAPPAPALCAGLAAACW